MNASPPLISHLILVSIRKNATKKRPITKKGQISWDINCFNASKNWLTSAPNNNKFLVIEVSFSNFEYFPLLNSYKMVIRKDAVSKFRQ